jgi:hypothetical protein
VERVSGEWSVVDDGRSRNGTFVNGERARGRRRLRDADLIRLVARRSCSAIRPRVAAHPAVRRGLGSAAIDAQRRVLVAVCRPFGRSAFAVPPTTRQIADELVIGVETVKTHLRSLFEAFDIVDLPQNQKRAGLARRALEAGVVGPADFDEYGRTLAGSSAGASAWRRGRD